MAKSNRVEVNINGLLGTDAALQMRCEFPANLRIKPAAKVELLGLAERAETIMKQAIADAVEKPEAT